ncbi:purine-nucleoside phosphorylase [Serpentinicella alkaliphila]|uniref:Purine nucleoside phosphorylase n=1 Tax=Serpentinicella alkaliphila TaxID=1734049 RepID=A0A4R2TNU1_9FIRM|nr:purine-nucleoside phosphorylase [Serpentinicella alkaliphila]QUH26589.1 purine-nucleoside phosphorylase [Serpentinicella alkaliphila]TCQ02945.1 purine-nucleoside phosphorylase [Serpentinicella alkaliphila]
MNDILNKVREAKEHIESEITVKPQVGLILGSGLGTLADEIKNPIILDYDEIPHFPISTVEGHAGNLVIGELEGKIVVAMKGRFHYYEGYSMQEVTFPVRVMKALGIEHIIITNACGGLNSKLYPGALMIINDHINFTGDNPLIGRNYEEFGPRFPDMSTAYNKDLIKLAHKVGKEIGVETFEGVYISISGPNYLSKAELSMMINFGADTVGMSTVPEVIVANHMGMKILGISCVTDMAIPNQLESISHEQVMEVANKTRPKFISLVKGILNEVNI